MQNNGVWAALSAEIRVGNIQQDALESLRIALETGLMGPDEHEYLEDIVLQHELKNALLGRAA